MLASPIKAETFDPQWQPPEKFTFFVSTPRSKILISVYHYNPSRPENPRPIGDTILDLDKLAPGEKSKKMVLKSLGRSSALLQ
jgi:hypothetical protein